MFIYELNRNIAINMTRLFCLADLLQDTVDGLVIGLAIGWAATAVLVFVIIKLCM